MDIQALNASPLVVSRNETEQVVLTLNKASKLKVVTLKKPKTGSSV